MPAYNFHGRFVDGVEDGRKTQTIRKRRKRPTVVGDTLYLYTGMRTKQCRKLLEARCLAVIPVDISKTEVRVEGRLLGLWALRLLARADGFGSEQELVGFFERTYGLPFEGEIIQW